MDIVRPSVLVVPHALARFAVSHSHYVCGDACSFRFVALLYTMAEAAFRCFNPLSRTLENLVFLL